MKEITRNKKTRLAFANLDKEYSLKKITKAIKDKNHWTVLITNKKDGLRKCLSCGEVEDLFPHPDFTNPPDRFDYTGEGRECPDCGAIRIIGMTSRSWAKREVLTHCNVWKKINGIVVRDTFFYYVTVGKEHEMKIEFPKHSVRGDKIKPLYRSVFFIKKNRILQKNYSNNVRIGNFGQDYKVTPPWHHNSCGYNLDFKKTGIGIGTGMRTKSKFNIIDINPHEQFILRGCTRGNIHWPGVINNCSVPILEMAIKNNNGWMAQLAEYRENKKPRDTLPKVIREKYSRKIQNKIIERTHKCTTVHQVQIMIDLIKEEFVDNVPTLGIETILGMEHRLIRGAHNRNIQTLNRISRQKQKVIECKYKLVKKSCRGNIEKISNVYKLRDFERVRWGKELNNCLKTLYKDASLFHMEINGHPFIVREKEWKVLEVGSYKNYHITTDRKKDIRLIEKELKKWRKENDRNSRAQAV